MASDPRLIIEVPSASPVERQLREDSPSSVASGAAVVIVAPTDARGRLEAAPAGQVVLSVPSPEGLARQADDVHRVIASAGTGVQPLVVVVESAEELREAEIAVLLRAAGHTSRPVILRIIGNG